MTSDRRTPNCDIEEPPRHQDTVDLRLFFDTKRDNWRQREEQLLKRIGGQNKEWRLSILCLYYWFEPLLTELLRRSWYGRRYQLANGMGAMLSADNAFTQYEYLVAPLLLQGNHAPDARILLLAFPLDIALLTSQCPALFSESDTVVWDEKTRHIKSESSIKPLAKPSEQELQQAILTSIRENGLEMLNFFRISTTITLTAVMR
ncbi:unnamed protein product [Ranitomeya imitator]|uniref:Uncharacterized protein n=1 Tax=Ranitomeya imitator TaxID=111125 RepID=A0ABN9M2B1_9NEOB|nr:unnamed protein product [Ranitomeya imitator]